MIILIALLLAVFIDVRADNAFMPVCISWRHESISWQAVASFESITRPTSLNPEALEVCGEVASTQRALEASQSVCSSSGRRINAMKGAAGPFQLRTPRTLSPLNVISNNGACLEHSLGLASKAKIEYVEVTQPKWDPCLLPPTNYVQLLNALHVAPTLGRLEELMQPDLLERYDAVHVSAALNRLPKLVRYREKDLVRTDVVLPRGSGIRPAVPIDSAVPRKSSSELAKALATTLCTMIPGHSRRMYPRQAANCVWALGTLHGMGIKVTDPVEKQKRRKGSGPVVEVSNERKSGGVSPEGSRIPEAKDARDGSLEGMVARMEASGMSHRFSHAYASLLEVVSADNFSAMNAHGQPSEAAQLLKGMSKLPRGCQPGFVVTGITRYVADHAERFAARELRTASWAIATMSDARLGGGLESIETAGAALVAIAKRAIQVDKSFTPAGIAAVLWAFAACKYSGTHLLAPATVTDLFTSLLAGIQPQVVLVVPQDIAMITWTCAKMHHHNPEVMKILGTKAADMLEQFRSHDLAQTLLAMAEGGFIHNGLFSATLKGIELENKISTDLGVATVAKTIQAFSLHCAEQAGRPANRGAGAGGQEGNPLPLPDPSSLLQRTRSVLQRIREPLAVGLSSQDRPMPCSPEDAALLAEALSDIQALDELVIKTGKTKSRENNPSGSGSGDTGSIASISAHDAPLVKALAARVEGLIPICSPRQLAQVMTAMQNVPLSSEGLMLAAAASSHLKSLLDQAQQTGRQKTKMLASEAQHAEGDMYQGHSSCLLNHAVDVLEACASLGLNDPALTSAIERFLVSAESAVNKRREFDHHGAKWMDPARLVRLLCRMCHSEGGGNGRDDLRAAISRLLTSSSSSLSGSQKLNVAALNKLPGAIIGSTHRRRYRAEVPIDLLAQAFGIYAVGASSAASSNKPASTDLSALELLAETLLLVVSDLKGTSEGRAITKSIKTAKAALGSFPSVALKLDRLSVALASQ